MREKGLRAPPFDVFISALGPGARAAVRVESARGTGAEIPIQSVLVSGTPLPNTLCARHTLGPIDYLAGLVVLFGTVLISFGLIVLLRRLKTWEAAPGPDTSPLQINAPSGADRAQRTRPTYQGPLARRAHRRACATFPCSR